MSVAEAIAAAGMQKYFNCIIARLNGYKVKSIAIVIDGYYMEVFNYGINQSKQEGNYPLQSVGAAAEGCKICQVVFLSYGNN